MHTRRESSQELLLELSELDKSRVSYHMQSDSRSKEDLTFWQLLEVLSEKEYQQIQKNLKDPEYVRKYELLKGRKP